MTSFVIVYDQKCDRLILFIKKVYNIGTNLNIIRLWYQYQFNEIISSGTERDTEWSFYTESMNRKQW